MAFINRLHLPGGFSASYHKSGRVHMKYKGKGFALLDFWSDYYNLSTREYFMRAINGTDYKIVTYQKRNNAVVKIPYSDNSLVLRLISYIQMSDDSILSIAQNRQISKNDVDANSRLVGNTENQIDDSYVEGKEKVVIARERVNQDLFRTKLDLKYNNKCCLCGVSIREILRASHIKPWSVSKPGEKVDIENGLLLCANHDQLFDSGFISFRDNGDIMVSDELDMHTRILTNVRSEMRIQVSEKMKEYLAYHRENVFRRG